MKKQNFIIIILMLFLSGFRFENERITKIKLYMVSWDAKYNLPMTIENIEDRYSYYFEKDGSDFYTLINDYSDCYESLKKQSLVEGEVSNSAIAYVELYFNKEKIKLFFKGNGDYYFEDRWYKMNPCLYYQLFYHFSNELVPLETLQSAQAKMGNLATPQCW